MVSNLLIFERGKFLLMILNNGKLSHEPISSRSELNRGGAAYENDLSQKLSYLDRGICSTMPVDSLVLLTDMWTFS